MKWTTEQSTVRYLRTLRQHALQDEPATASDIIAALRANPEARDAVHAYLMPSCKAAQADAVATWQHYEDRALAAEKARDEAKAEVKRVRDLIDRDRTGLAAGLDGVRQILRGWAWLAEPDNWGSYSYEDHNASTLRKEVATLLREAHAVIANAMKDSGRRADSAFYPEHPDRSATIDALRSERDAALSRLAEVERERDAEREERAKVERWYQASADECKALREVLEAARVWKRNLKRSDVIAADSRALWDAVSRLDARGSAESKTPGGSDSSREHETQREQCRKTDIVESPQRPLTAEVPSGANVNEGSAPNPLPQPVQSEPAGGFDSSVGVAATAEDGREAPAQNRQRADQPSDPATGTTRREPPESACSGASTGAVALTRCVFCKGSGIQAGPGEYTAEPCYGCNGTGLKPPPRPALTPEQRAEVVLRSELLDALRLAATRQAFSTGVLPPHAKMLADVAAHLLKGGE